MSAGYTAVVAKGPHRNSSIGSVTVLAEWCAVVKLSRMAVENQLAELKISKSGAAA